MVSDFGVKCKHQTSECRQTHPPPPPLRICDRLQCARLDGGCQPGVPQRDGVCCACRLLLQPALKCVPGQLINKINGSSPSCQKLQVRNSCAPAIHVRRQLQQCAVLWTSSAWPTSCRLDATVSQVCIKLFLPPVRQLGVDVGQLPALLQAEARMLPRDGPEVGRPGARH